MKGVITAIFLGLALAQALPQGQRPAGLFDDMTGTTYNQALLAAYANQDLSGVQALELIPDNHHHQHQVERRSADVLMKRHHKPEPRPPTHMLGPWMKYKQTYWNPFIYGGPNGPPTFYPSLGVWPTYNQGQQQRPQQPPPASYNQQPSQYLEQNY